MLVAKERFDYQSLPLDYNYRKVQTKKVRKAGPRVKTFYCFLVLLALTLAFLVASKHAQIASAGYGIVDLKKQMQMLETENQVLEGQVEKLKALENIERVAMVKLGMQKPEFAEGVQFVPVEYSKAWSNSAVGVASAADIQTEPELEPKKSSIVQALVKLLNG